MKMKCWVCGKDDFLPIGGEKNITLQPESFKITDSHYGRSLLRYRCKNCGFIQCNTAAVTSYYEQLEDEEYVDSSGQRALQFEKLLKSVEPYIPKKGRILDIGAGSGVFLRTATKRGYSTTGIEPSKYLVSKAKEEGQNVIQGTFPDNCPREKYDIIFLTDVIEHIADPLPMLEALPDFLEPGGKIIVTTPDVSSVMSKALGRRWWHYRIAHIGYYNKKTLMHIMGRAGMTSVEWKRAKWYFSSRYILERLSQYLPFVESIAKNAPEQLMIPLNLFDSWLAIFEVDKQA